ncbi:MAG: hypothetical protein ACR2H3_12380 [Acidimicrobiales bacterium]
MLKALAAAIAILLVAGIASLFVVDGDAGDDTAVGTTTTLVPLTAPTTVDTTPFDTTPVDTTVDGSGATVTTTGSNTTGTTAPGNGLGGGTGEVAAGSGEHPSTGGGDLLLPGLALLGVAVGMRRVRLLSNR